MTRKEQLVFCKKCTNREFSITEGILCKLTGAKADFEHTCSDYRLDKEKEIQTLPKVTIRPNQKRAAIAVQLLWAVLILNLFTMVSDYMQYGLLEDLKIGFDVSDQELTANDYRVQFLAILYLAVYIICIICFIRWFRRAYYNLGARTRINHDEGWAAGAWFVPIISLFRPYKIMVELFEKTHSLIIDRTGDLNKKNTGKIYLGFWWALWIIGIYVGNYSFKTAFNDETIEGLMRSTQADIFVSAIEIPLGILAIFIVTEFSKKENRLTIIETEAKKAIELIKDADSKSEN